MVGEAGDVAEAIACIRTTNPEGVLLDIQLPSGSGFDILEEFENPPHCIFVTAHHEYAVTAFELAALDYILKPYSRERLEAALDRLRKLQPDESSGLPDRLATARSALSPSPPNIVRLFIRRGRRILVVPVDDIVRIEADGMYTRLVTEKETHVATIPLSTLLPRLPADQFQRVHRAHIVNLSSVTGFTVLPAGRLDVHLANGATVPCSREYARTIRSRSF